MSPAFSRRAFIRVSSLAGAGLVIGFGWPGGDSRADPGPRASRPNGGKAKNINAFVKIGADDSVVLVVPASEMGQGVFTSIPMILADELDVDLARVEVLPAPCDPPVYGNPESDGRQ